MAGANSVVKIASTITILGKKPYQLDENLDRCVKGCTLVHYILPAKML